MSLFGVHIPELQLAEGDFHEALTAAALRPGETYLELGCGHGRGLIVAARDFEARAVGVDYLPDALDRARKLAARAGVTVELVREDLMQHDPTDADVVLVHLGPAFHDVLAPRFEDLLTPTTRVVACGWDVPGWIEQWGSYGFAAGYVYRPGDPRQHGEWSAPGITPHAAPGQPLPELHRVLGATPNVDVVEFRAGVDLREIELRLDGPLADRLTVRAGAHALGRGQHTLVEVRWPASAAGAAAAAAPTTLDVWARSHSGRFTQRGVGLHLLPH